LEGKAFEQTSGAIAPRQRMFMFRFRQGIRG
jgi:hypothetical protein